MMTSVPILERLEQRLLLDGLPFGIDGTEFIRTETGEPVFFNIIGYQPLEPGQAVTGEIRETRVADDLDRMTPYTDGSDPLALRVYAQPTEEHEVRMPKLFYDGVRDLGIWIIRDIYFGADDLAFNIEDFEAGHEKIDAVLYEAQEFGGFDRILAWEIGDEFGPVEEEGGGVRRYTDTDVEAFIEDMVSYLKAQLAGRDGVSDWVTWGSYPPWDVIRSGGSKVLPDGLDFYSYNCYSYEPQSIRDHQGGPGTGRPYGGYVAALAEYLPDKPLVVSETGFSDFADPVDTHAERYEKWAPSYWKGGLSEETVAEALAERYWDVRLSGVASGFGLFEFSDEHWKGDDPASPTPWLNDHAESSFGIMRYDADTREAEFKLQQETIRDLYTLRHTDEAVTVTPTDTSLGPGETTTVTVTPPAEFTGPCRFRWEASRGTIVGDADSVQFRAPDVVLGDATVTVICMDATGRAATGTAAIEIEPPGARTIELLTLAPNVGDARGHVSGRVANVDLDAYKVACYLQTSDRYVVPYDDMTGIWIRPDGYWWSRANNGHDGDLYAYIVPKDYEVVNLDENKAPPDFVASAELTAANDADNDRLRDAWEQDHWSNLDQEPWGDPDDDGEQNIDEMLREGDGADPTVPDNDQDGDGLDDGWERRYLGSTTYAAGDDPDGDGLTNEDERDLNLHPGRSAVDTDRDLLPDRWETRCFGNLDYAAGDDFGNGKTILDAYEQGTSETLLDDGDRLVIANIDAVALATAVPVLLKDSGSPAAQAALADQLVISYDVGAGDYRQAFVIDSNGVMRLRHLDGDESGADEDHFGTSVALPPHLCLDDGTKHFYRTVRIDAFTLDTTDAASGVLRITATGSPSDGAADAPVSVTWNLTVTDPTNEATEVAVDVEAVFDPGVLLHEDAMNQAEAFCAAVYNSHNTEPSGSDTHDADRLRITDAAGIELLDLDLAAVDAGQLLLPEGAGTDGLPFDGALQLNQLDPAEPNGDPPCVQISIDPQPGVAYRAQGFVTDTTDVNADNLGVWAARTFDDAGDVAGQTFSWTFHVLATDEVAPVNSLIALDWDDAGGTEQVRRLDPESARSEAVSGLPDLRTWHGESVITSDGTVYAAGNAVDGTYRLFSLNVHSRATETTLIDLPAGILPELVLCGMYDGGLVGLGWDTGGSELTVLDVDPTTGAAASLGTVDGIQWWQRQATLVADDDRLYVAGTPDGVSHRLYTFDLNAGSVVGQPDAIPAGLFFAGADGSGDPVGLSWNGAAVAVYRIDADLLGDGQQDDVTGGPVGTLDELWAWSGEAATDPTVDRLYATGLDRSLTRRLCAFDVAGGGMIEQQAVPDGFGAFIRYFPRSTQGGGAGAPTTPIAAVTGGVPQVPEVRRLRVAAPFAHSRASRPAPHRAVARHDLDLHRTLRGHEQIDRVGEACEREAMRDEPVDADTPARDEPQRLLGVPQRRVTRHHAEALAEDVERLERDRCILRRHAEEQDASVVAGEAHRLLDDRRHAGGIDYGVVAAGDFGSREAIGRVDGDIGREFAGEIEPGRDAIGDDDSRGPTPPRDLREQDADWARADHQDLLAEPHVQLLHPVQHARQRLHERG
jgi:hypothetical protein